jgi:hypothetical protein
MLEQNCRTLGRQDRGSEESAKQEVGCGVRTDRADALAPSCLQAAGTRLKTRGIDN